MIKPYNGAKAAKFSNREPLPRGAYVLQIVGAKVESYDCELNVGGELIQLPVAIERKMDLDEMCLCSGKQRKRFEKELERAKEKGIELYLLVEKASWGKAYEGDYRSKLSAKSLVGSLLTWEKRYKMPVHYCEPEFAAIHIRDILHYAAREWLSNAE